MNETERNFDEVLQRVETARLETDEHAVVKVIAVSKSVGSKEIESLYDLGQRAFGENRVQDLKEKSEKLAQIPLEWHFVGRLQKNKINHLLDISPALIHSCDGYELAKEIDKRAKVKDMQVNTLLQINSAKEEAKAGVLPEYAEDEYHKILEECKNINLKGVMSIGAYSDDENEIKKSFETTYKIFEKLQKDGAKYCSMGMSGDFELAIKCGSNMLRLGSILFR